MSETVVGSIQSFYPTSERRLLVAIKDEADEIHSFKIDEVEIRVLAGFDPMESAVTRDSFLGTRLAVRHHQSIVLSVTKPQE